MSGTPDDLAALPRERTLDNARRWVVAYLARILEVPSAQIELSQGIAAFGLDSVDAVVMSGAMEEHFQVEIDAGLYLNEATLDENIAQLRDDPQWQDASPRPG